MTSCHVMQWMVTPLTQQQGDARDTGGTEHPVSMLPPDPGPTSITPPDSKDMPQIHDGLESRGGQDSHASRDYVQETFASDSETVSPHLGHDISTLRGADTDPTTTPSIGTNEGTSTWFFEDGFMDPMNADTMPKK